MRPMGRNRQRRAREGSPGGAPRPRDERGAFAIFIAVIAVTLLLFGGIAYDAPRLINARQQAQHLAEEAARVGAATVAAGGIRDEAREAAEDRIARTPALYGATPELVGFACDANRVQVTVRSSYRSRSALAVFRSEHTILATGTAEALLLGPDGKPVMFAYLPDCPPLGA